MKVGKSELRWNPHKCQYEWWVVDLALRKTMDACFSEELIQEPLAKKWFLERYGKHFDPEALAALGKEKKPQTGGRETQ